MSITPLTSPQRLSKAHTALQQDGRPYVTVSVTDDGSIRAMCAACAIGPCASGSYASATLAMGHLPCTAGLRDMAARDRDAAARGEGE